MSYIGPVTRDLLTKCAVELQKKETKEMLAKNIFDPAFYEISKKVYPYVTLFCLLQIIILILLIYIIILLRNRT